MLPRFPLTNIFYGLPESLSERSVGMTVNIMKAPDVYNIVLAEKSCRFQRKVCAAIAVSSIGNCMPNVFLPRNPFQILNTVILLVAVFMVYKAFHGLCRWAKKTLRDQTVHCSSIILVVARKTYRWVSSNRVDVLALFSPLLSCVFAALKNSIATNSITGKSRDVCVLH